MKLTPAIAILIPALLGIAHAQDLPRFLPQNGNNVHVARGLLRTWPAAGPRQLWRLEIGYGKSSVAESQGRLYTATQIDKKQYALCLDAATGKTLWQKLLVPTDNHHIVKGPVNGTLVDGDRAYFFPYGCLNGDMWEPRSPCFCLRTSDGAILWSESQAYNCSEGSTPLIVGDTLYIGGGGRDCALAAVDKLTGKLLWKIPVDRDTGHKHVFVTGASLIHQQIGDIPQIVVCVYKNDLMGVHAKTGKVLWHWTLPHPTNSGQCPTPVAIGSRLLLTASQGTVDYCTLLELTASDGVITPRVVYENLRLQCNQFHTPSILNGAAFGFGKGTEHDALQCTRLDDGQLLWQQESLDWARDRQLTIADGLIFAITKKDELVLLEASPAGYQELSRFNPQIKLGLPQQPMIANGRLYLRGDDTLACYKITPD